MTPTRIALLAAAALAAYVLACALQCYLIAEKLGTGLSFCAVLKSTVKLMFAAGPWVPFVMQPPSGSG